MTWVVVIFSSNFPRRVVGPMSKDTAEALALGFSMRTAGGGGEQAVALSLETP